jgi:protoporphyrinogen oxidase
VLGTLFNSASFPGRVANARVISLTTMLGGTSRPEILELQDSEIEGTVRDELRVRFGAELKLVHRVIHRWPRAIPLYDQCLSAAWTRARAGWCAQPGHLLFGNYTGQVSIRGMIEDLDEIRTQHFRRRK